MLEASFTDMRHGGDGDLSRAYILAQKVSRVTSRLLKPSYESKLTCSTLCISEPKDQTSTARDQPFPDSWIATTAPLALGLLTDITSEILLPLGAEGRERLWPLIARQFLVWCVGRPFGDKQTEQDGVWWPCEALVRVACNEIQRLPERVTVSFPGLYQFERVGWTSMFLTMFANALTRTVQHEKKLERDLFRARNKSRESVLSSESDSVLPQVSEDSDLGPPPKPESQAIDSEVSLVGEVILDTEVSTPYGKGRIVENRKDCYENNASGKKYTHVSVNVIDLDFGAKLYRPDPNSIALKDTAAENAEEQLATGLDLLDLGDDPTGKFLCFSLCFVIPCWFIRSVLSSTVIMVLTRRVNWSAFGQSGESVLRGRKLAPNVGEPSEAGGAIE